MSDKEKVFTLARYLAFHQGLVKDDQVICDETDLTEHDLDRWWCTAEIILSKAGTKSEEEIRSWVDFTFKENHA